MYMYFSITVGEVCPFNGTLTYSFDYAQQVHYPHHAQEVGPLFFKLQGSVRHLEYVQKERVHYLHVYVLKNKKHH